MYDVRHGRWGGDVQVARWGWSWRWDGVAWHGQAGPSEDRGRSRVGNAGSSLDGWVGRSSGGSSLLCDMFCFVLFCLGGDSGRRVGVAGQRRGSGRDSVATAIDSSGDFVPFFLSSLFTFLLRLCSFLAVRFSDCSGSASHTQATDPGDESLTGSRSPRFLDLRRPSTRVSDTGRTSCGL
jgi:hypothetical protein